MYLLDTDWLIEAIAARQRTVAIVEKLADAGLAISSISLAELYEGAFYSPNPQASLDTFRRLLRGYRLLLPDGPIMERFAELRAFLRRRGQLIEDFDLLIAATALHHNLTLLTYNRRHFER